MFKFLCLRNIFTIRSKFSNVSTNNIVKRSITHNRISHGKNSKQIGGLGWCLLIIPVSTFALGTWQVQRKKWKESLILELKSRTSINPFRLPHSLEEIEDLEYYPVHVRGYFLHDEEMYLGPRSLMQGGDAATSSALISNQQNRSQGYLVVTPFVLEDGRKILVNRGWISHKLKDPKYRPKGQIKGEVDVVGIIRLQENRPTFMPTNKPESNSWFFKDVKAMAMLKGTEPIFLDATNDFDIEGGPVGGQTRITLRNEHMSYIITWYSLSAITSFMWYSQFIRKVIL